MSENRKKDLRTQGRFSDEFKKGKSHEKVRKTSPKESDAKLVKNQTAPRSYVDILKEKPVEYTKNTSYSFNELASKKEPIEIKNAGEKILSESENGLSRVFYAPVFMEEQEADAWFLALNDEIPWDERKIIIRGKEYPQPRLVMWYGPYPYTYSGLTLEPAEMPKSVVAIKHKVEQYLSSIGLNVTLNSVLLNLYRDCHDSIAWHSDDELSMGVEPTIASVSLGGVRRFMIRKKPDPHESANIDPKEADYFVQLTNGSLLIMDGCMQKDWQHSVPKEYHDKDPRINLTFRTVYALDKEVSKMDDRIHESNKRLTMKETENISEVPLMKATNHSTTHLSKRADVFPDKSTTFICPLEFPPLDDNKLNTSNYKKALVQDSVIKSRPEKNERLEIKQDNQGISLCTDTIRETSSAPFNNRKNSLVEKSNNSGTKQDSQDKSMNADLVVETTSNAQFNDRNCALAEKSDSNETKQNSRDKPMHAYSPTETLSSAPFNDRNDSSAEKSDSNETKQDIPDKSMFAGSIRETASNALFNDRNHNVNDYCLDKREPDQEKPCPPFSNQSKIVVGTALNVHANPFVPCNFVPAFSSKPKVSKEIEGKPEENKVFVVPDSEQSSYTGNRENNLSQDFLDVLDLQPTKLVENTDLIVQEISHCIESSLFSDRDRGELKFLCEISDGYQNTRNQTKICIRIRDIVQNAILAQSDSRNKMMRSSQFRQAAPPRHKSNMSPRHHNQHKFEKRTDAMYKRQ